MEAQMPHQMPLYCCAERQSEDLPLEWGKEFLSSPNNFL
jgi:hypothetical protein